MEWYYVKDGEQCGPFDEGDFKKMIKRGEVRQDDLAWSSLRGGEWEKVADIEELGGRLPPLDTLEPSGEPPLEGQYYRAGEGGRGATDNRELMQRARESLTGRWGTAVLVVFVQWVISIGLSIVPFAGRLVELIITGPIQLGVTGFFLNIGRRRHAEVGQMFEGFSSFGRALAAHILIVLFIILWALLFIVPGIIAAYSYSMTFYILADNPGVGAREAIGLSKEMMKGYKWKFVLLNFRFIGWSLLALLTCGIGFIWLVPYMTTAIAHFYEDIRG